MTIHTSHPMQATACETFLSYGGVYRSVPMVRRIAGFSTRFACVDLLVNNAGVRRESWDASVSFGSFTLAVVRK